MWSLDLNKTKSINDSAFQDLLVGTHDYVITKAEFAKDTRDVTGKTFYVVLGFDSGEGHHTLVLRVMDAKDVTRQIANKTIKGICDAVGFSGTMEPARLHKLKDKKVRITTYAKESTNAEGKTFTNVNVKLVEAVPGAPAPAAPVPAPAPVPAYVPPAAPAPAYVPPPAAEYSAPAEPTPAADPAAFVPPWKPAVVAV